MSKLHVKFKQAVHLDGKDYAKDSIHEVTEKLAGHHYFKKLVNSGLVIEAQPAQIITPKTLQERQADLAEKLLSKSPSKLEAEKVAAKAKADEEAKAAEEAGDAKEESLAEQELEAEAEVEAEEAEHKEHPAHKNKKHKK